MSLINWISKLEKLILSVLLIAASAQGSLALASAPRPRPKRVPARAANVPAPRDVLGFTPGDDRKLASWAQITDYFRQLDRASRASPHHPLNETFTERPFPSS